MSRETAVLPLLCVLASLLSQYVGAASAKALFRRWASKG